MSFLREVTGDGRVAVRASSSLRCALLGALVVSPLLSPLVAGAQTSRPAEAPAGATQLRDVTVSASRSERPIEDVPASITVREAEELERDQVRSVRDLERYEPGVSVRRAPARFTAAGASTGRPGNEGFNIRGLEGNRVLIQVDGVRVPNSFSFGANAFGRGDWLDVATIKRVEILRGPASTLYGSDGLAGVVSFYTFDPADLLRRSGKDTYLTAGLGWSQDDRSFTKLLGGAARAGNWEAMAFYTRRDGHELRTKGDNDALNLNRTKANPQDYGSNALLAKLVYNLSPNNQIRLSVDLLDRDQRTDAWSAVAVPPLAGTSTLGLTADDDMRRLSVVVDQRIRNLGLAWADSVRWHLYSQNAKARQFAFEDRNTAADRTRDSTYEERWTGAGVVLDRAFDTGAIGHRLVYGVDAARARYEGVRDGTVPPAGETFPTRAFPNTRYDLLGAFVQDEIAFGDGRFSVIPGLRWDKYRYDPSSDALYTLPVVSASDSHFSPRLGLILRLPAEHSLFANLSEGFRAPTADQLNNGFANTVANYRSVANADLKPETSRSIEIGARRSSRNLYWTASAFSGRYKDFIDQRQVSGNFTVANPAIFQFVNVGEVKIHGVEGTGWWRFAPGLRATGGFSVVRGDNETNGLPLNTVDPFKLIAGLDWEPKAGTSVGFRATHVGAKKADRIDSAALVTAPAVQYETPSYTTLDLVASWQIDKRFKVSAGLFNFTHRKYWRWSDVRGLSSSSNVIDAYSQPGRTLTLNARIEL